jgi:hypothetical protein
MKNTIETNNFINNIKDYDIFVIANRGEPLYLIEIGYYLKGANKVYLETKLDASNLLNEIKEHPKTYVLLLKQDYEDKFWEKHYFFDKNPQMKEKLKFVAEIVISERVYDWYRIK